MRTMFKAMTLAAAVMTAAAAQARDVALVISNPTYPGAGVSGPTRGVDAAVQALADRGFAVTYLKDLSSPETWRNLRTVLDTIEPADRVIVWADGQVVNSGREAWLLGRQAQSPDIYSVGGQGVPLSPLMAMLGKRPGQGLMLVSTLAGTSEPGEGLRAGAGRIAVPQGVTLISGARDAVAQLVREIADRPGRSIAAYLATAGNEVQGRGFLPRNFPLLGRTDQRQDLTEQDFWQAADIIGTREAYQAYLEQYRGGRFAAQARERLNELKNSKADQARLDEEALGLDDDQRRAIQGDLVLLGHNTGGIDGILGRGSRAAIAAWQRQNGLVVTSYLTGNQISRLRSQAAARARELELEARARQAEIDRKDRTHWAETGKGATEDGILAYLERFPDGLFAEQARERLKQIETDKARLARAEERQAWNEAAQKNTRKAYRKYLKAYPDGQFAALAKNRLRDLERTDTDREDFARAKAEEQEIMRFAPRALAAEGALKLVGLNPGPVDGKIDAQTRRAVRQFQKSRELPVSGFIDKATFVRLTTLK